MKERRDFDAFDDASYEGRSDFFKFGCLEALAEYLGYHCTVEKCPISGLVLYAHKKFPGRVTDNPLAYINYLYLEFNKLHPTYTKMSQTLQYRFLWIINSLENPENPDQSQNHQMLLGYASMATALNEKYSTPMIVKYRKAKNMTQTEAAQALNLSLRQYQRYETPSTDALKNAGPEMLEKVCLLLGVKHSNLLQDGFLRLETTPMYGEPEQQ